MINRVCAAGQRLFPKRQLLLRSTEGVSCISLPGWLQAIALGVWLLSLGGVSYITAGYIHLQKALHVQASESSASTRDAVADLHHQLDAANAQYESVSEQYQQMSAQYAGVSGQLQTLRQHLASITTENSSLRGTLGRAQAQSQSLETARSDLEHKLETTQQALNGHATAETAATARAELSKHLAAVQSELETADAHSEALKAAVIAKDNQLQQLASERDRLRHQLDGRSVASLESDVPLLSGSKSGAGATQDAAHSATAGTSSASELQRLIASTGVDVNRILGHISRPSDEGGPYVALGSIKRTTVEESARIEALRQLANTLPLGSPLSHYVLKSNFGPRVDPINGRPSFHPGLDLAAPYRSPVFSTGPGIVSFTGNRDGYGRVVEIDHGHGIVTRYAHLHRILVARGQRVAAHQTIGELGSTGRSTGPHVHYEILVDGAPQDPAKFMQVGKNVVQARN